MNILEMRVFGVMPDMWCKSCGQFKPFERFTPMGDGRAYTCLDCMYERRSGEGKKKEDA